ncbi:MAG TPA: LPS export ABC transporter periplasmic protein LptC [Fibrobacteraceae bacterium]|jgi:LPS export ABC transporter protein LptC|nr:LPS export ABC transporter periplasmic protein LptC [Fibrobacter sp.]HOG67904.1 LPS export ABC transporter periplasmic protein LptC [Fibrobacteraceae bacterium]HPW93775.1 LPS export ABC transporter periplasmic protein LptC [Fibrobacteraceae bacterium]
MACFLHRTLNKTLKNLQWILIGGISFLCAGLFSGCEKIEEDAPWINVERPLMLFNDTTLLDFYEEEVLSWKLKTAYLERWASNDKVFARPILVDIFDSLGEKVAFLRADSGRLDMGMNYVFAYGHVFAFTPKGASVRADSLLWHKRDNMVKTDSYVRVVTEDGDVLQGKGFISDAKMDNWRILSEVTGIFQDAAKRLKEEDKTLLEETSSPSSTREKPSTKNEKQESVSNNPRMNKAKKTDREVRVLTDKEVAEDRQKRSMLKRDSLRKERGIDPKSKRPRARRMAE